MKLIPAIVLGASVSKAASIDCFNCHVEQVTFYTVGIAVN